MRAVRRQVRCRVDRKNAGHFLRVLGGDSLEDSVGMRAAHDARIGLPRLVEVVRVAAFAAQQGGVFRSGDWVADSRHGQDYCKEIPGSPATTKEIRMNWDRIEGNWKQVKGKVKEQW